MTDQSLLPRLLFLLVLGLTTVVRPLAAQATFDRLSIADGLSQSTVKCIVQDAYGYMWFGTEDGLNKYDGYDFSVYKPEAGNPVTLSDNSVMYLYEDRAQTLWVATEDGGLNRFDRATEQFTAYRHDPDDPTSISSDLIFVLMEDQAGLLWLGTDQGLNRFDPSTGQARRYRRNPEDPASLPSDSVYAILEDRNGALWIGTSNGSLSHFDPETGQFTAHPLATASSTSHSVLDLIEGDDGRLWLSTGFGLSRYDPATGEAEHYTHDPADPLSLSEGIVYVIQEDAHGHLWVGTLGGGLNLFRPETKTFTRYLYDPLNPHSLSDNSIYFLYEDRADKLWIGTLSGGVNRLADEESRFVNYLHDPFNPNTINHDDIWAVYEDRAGSVWVSTTEDGLNRLDPATGVVTRYQHSPRRPNGILPGVVYGIYEPPSTPGVLWVSMEETGLSRFDTRTGVFTHIRPAPDRVGGLPANPIHSIHEDRQGRLWLATEGDGLARLDTDTEAITTFTQKADSLFDYDAIFDIHEDRLGRLWLSTAQGVSRFDPATEAFTLFGHDPDDLQSLSAAYVTAILEAQDGTFWFGTTDGLNKMTSRPYPDENGIDEDYATFKRYTENDGLPNQVIYGIVEDDEGHLWLSTNRGLSRFTPATETFHNYNINDGLTTLEFNQGVSHKGPSGTIYFGGIDGLTSFRPERFQNNAYTPPIVITAFRKFDEVVQKDITAGTDITLRHSENFFSFDFAALDYTNSQKNRYAYKMDPFDPDWREAGTRRYAGYTNLDPGAYTFYVKGSNSDGLWNEEGIAVNIEILPPWWQTWWFRLANLLILVIGVGGGTLGWLQSRIRKVERVRDEKIEIQRRIADRLEAERLHFARELHDGPIQTLQLAGFQYKQLDALVYDEEARNTIARLRETTQNVMLTLRAICGDLRPPALVHFGLARAIQSHADKFLEHHPSLNIELDLQHDAGMLPDRTRLGLFRIYQETMNNAAKHAGPCIVVVRLILEPDEVTLEVEDDGKGFVMPERWAALAEQEHYGLLGAAERAEAIGGRLRVQSSPGRCTVIRVVAPRVLPPPPPVAVRYAGPTEA